MTKEERRREGARCEHGEQPSLRNGERKVRHGPTVPRNV
jgi:hypothetical protein